MMRLTLSRIAELCDGRLIGHDAPVQGMSHDTRTLRPGNLFVALAGENSDGHRFVAAAANAGAGGALVARPVDSPLAQVGVDNVLQAMGQVAAAWRRELSVRIAGITGSNGKTTVKDMLAAICSRIAPSLSTGGNYNNEIGVPLTLARLAPEHRYAIIEMGASQSGDIRYLASLAEPEVGIVTNAAAAHLEGFGSLEGVARTKGEMFEALKPGGTAIINRDDTFYPLWRDMAGHCSRLTFGLAAEADVRAEMSPGGVKLQTPSGTAELRLPLPGRHNLLNALAATAAGLALEVELANIVAALTEVRSPPGRLQMLTSRSGARLLDDTYNANPASLYAGLEVLCEMEGEPWLVLGDMAELGADAERLHAEMGQTAADLGVRRLLTCGPISRAASAAFGLGARHFDQQIELIKFLDSRLSPDICCLVKGSRSMAMERVVHALVGEVD